MRCRNTTVRILASHSPSSRSLLRSFLRFFLQSLSPSLSLCGGESKRESWQKFMLGTKVNKCKSQSALPPWPRPPRRGRSEREREGAIERAALSCNSQGYPAVRARQAMPCERDEQRQQGWFLTFERRHFALPGYQDTYTNTPTPTHLCESHPQESEGWGLPA